MQDPPPPDDAPPATDIPDPAKLYDAALNYLARYAATEAGLRQVLLRRVDRWARALPDPDSAEDQIATARRAIGPIIARLVALKAVDDAAFAASRSLGLLRSGVSRRGVTAKLAAKGIPPAQAASALPDDPEAELAAAVVLTRKRRIGPFRATETDDPAVRRREFGIMARAGFPSAIAREALAMDREAAEARILALRQ